MSPSDANIIGWRGPGIGTKLKPTTGWYDNGNDSDTYGSNGLNWRTS